MSAKLLAGSLPSYNEYVKSLNTNNPLSLHACPVQDGCPYCQTIKNDEEWKFIPFMACICLRERQDRLKESAQQFHRVGLCRRIIYYRPTRPPESEAPPGKRGAYGCWESHRMISILASLSQAPYCLVFEDDVEFKDNFVKNKSRLLAEISACLLGSADNDNNKTSHLPQDWDTFHLGHTPIASFPIGNKVLRTFSACTHAYFQSAKFMKTLAATPYGRAPSGIGEIDTFIWRKCKQYSFYPILCVQSTSESTISGQPWLSRQAGKFHSEYTSVQETVALVWPIALIILLLVIILAVLIWAIVRSKNSAKSKNWNTITDNDEGIIKTIT